MTDSPTVVGRDVVISTTIAAPPDEVFDYLIDLDKLTRWMGYEGEVVAEPEGVFRLRVTDNSDWAVGEFVEIDRPSRVVLTWGWEGSDLVPPGSSTVTITVEADGDHSVVTLTHSGLCQGQDDEHEKGWTYFFGRLAVAGSGGDPGPQAH